MNEPLTDILSWTWFSEPHGYDFNGSLILDPAGNLCIDPVEPSEGVLDRLSAEGVSMIVVTNRNHTRAANLVRERTGARIWIHSADRDHADAAGTTCDAHLDVGQQVGPFSVVGVPGKSPGEVALHDPTRRLLVVGDALIGNPPGRLSLLPERVMDDPALLRASVRALLELDFDAIMVGDGVPIQEGARERLQELVATFPSN